MAAALAAQIDTLRGADGTDLVTGRPAWADWSAGAWPEPHDPVFDFSTPYLALSGSIRPPTRPPRRCVPLTICPA